MKRLVLLVLLSLFFAPVTYAANDYYKILTDLCSKNLVCPNGIDKYDADTYGSGKIHKALAIGYLRSGDSYVLERMVHTGFYNWGESNSAKASMEAMKKCSKRNTKNHMCSLLFVNDSIRDQKLYKILSKEKKIAIPANAHAFGSFWICDKNYYRNKAETACLRVPANASSPSTINFYNCNAGFKKSGNKCIPKLVIPKNAKASGSGWVCNSGFQKLYEQCLKAPANSHLSGSTWVCDSGYKIDDPKYPNYRCRISII